MADTDLEPDLPDGGDSARGRSRPDLSVVVIALGNPVSLVGAVKSIRTQDTRAEVVVVNSGGGDAAGSLRAAGLDVEVIEQAERLFPGGARNLGIAAATGKFIAFLAADCLAEPGWVSRRLVAHYAGAPAVGSALLCHRPSSAVAMAAHLSLFYRRMPRIPPPWALAYGASYQRPLFEEFGLFREDLEGGEDTEFHLRLPAWAKPIWCPEIRTIHFGSESLGEFCRDQFKRGRRAAEAWRRIDNSDPRAFARGVLERIGHTLSLAVRLAEPKQRLAATLALPLILLGGVVYAAGAWLAGNPNRDREPAPKR